MSRATATAHPNIALAKYWGKREAAGNVPATPSVSITLGALVTTTTVTFDESLAEDVLVLGGVDEKGERRDRVTAMLDEIRVSSGRSARARVVSENDFPTASGLASSASGFAALARAASAAAGLNLDERALGRMARRASASAARSIPGGFVALGTEDDAAAERIAPADHWDVSVVVAAVTHASKAVSSTRGMNHTRDTSPYYAAWLGDAPRVAQAIREAIVARDLERLGALSEASAFRMHACAMSANPALIYFSAKTIDLVREVQGLRSDGIGAWATIDAGPHVKVLCRTVDSKRVADRLAPHAVQVIVSGVGDGAQLAHAEAA